MGEKDISLKEGMWRNEKTVRLSAVICGCGGAFAAAIADNALRWLRARAAAGGAGALWSGQILAPLDTELEEYVAGVVAAEMPAAFPEEALKAQAVAARTYQVRQMQAAGSRDVLYDVGQAYLSEAEQKEKWARLCPICRKNP